MGTGYEGPECLQDPGSSVPSSACAQCTRPGSLWPQPAYDKSICQKTGNECNKDGNILC